MGTKIIDQVKRCHNCDGAGEVQEHNFDKEIDSPMFNIVTCRFCNGTGEEIN